MYMNKVLFETDGSWTLATTDEEASLFVVCYKKLNAYSGGVLARALPEGIHYLSI